MSRLTLIGLNGLILLTATSCSDELNSRRRMASSDSIPQIGLVLHDPSATHNLALAADSTAAQPSEAALPNTAIPPTADRQIIYRASISLQIKSFADTDAKLVSLVKQADGFIAQFSEDRSSGTQRGGRWTVRLPVANFTSFLDSVGQLGVADRREVQSQDMTEEYVDLEARLKNKQALESRLLDLVAKRSDNIKDVISVETELGRVREEIERLQGKLRYLNDRVSLTTIEITAYERLDYQPPEATFAAQIGSTFRVSVDRLRQFAESCVLAVTALVPWAAVAAMPLLMLSLAIRRRLRRASPISIS